MTSTFKVDLGVIKVHTITKFGDPKLNTFGDMIFWQVWILVTSHPDIQKAMHKSPPCIRTGGLKKVWIKDYAPHLYYHKYWYEDWKDCTSPVLDCDTACAREDLFAWWVVPATMTPTNFENMKGYYKRQGALRKRNFVVMGFAMKVLCQDRTFVMKCTLNALCQISLITGNQLIQNCKICCALIVCERSASW